MKIIGHRGASYDAPENTLASIKKAWADGADGVEIDVHLTRDDRVLTIHDSTMERTANTALHVEQTTLSELQLLDVGSWKNPQYAGEKPPTLEDVLCAIPHGKDIYIEIKSPHTILSALKRAISACNVPTDSIRIIGFSLDTLLYIRERLPELHYSQVVNVARKNDPAGIGWVESTIRVMKENGFDGVALGTDPNINRTHISMLKRAGLHVNIWTVDYPSDALRYQNYGVDSVSTNMPGYMRNKLASLPRFSNGKISQR